ncbi:right-handed parallel beta-helix repeat-containing protein [Paenibacillus cymbidii]|uniref:right-handed parallel beta-helix repeat-containing protein n=1 Tax=Paenibacillus cymbidii TaxID=1639034 RepID=UPI0014368BCC|nr:right-handed parallel beta-helix repeat-containing protein [Paenibacillus cymbidii]
MEETVYYVSPSGNDSWTGLLPDRSGEGTDGPFATLKRARDAVRQLKRRGLVRGLIRVQLRGGVYAMKEPLDFEAEDSATVVYEAYPGEEPILDGGQAIAGWTEEQLHGRTVWVAELPEVAAGRWYFRSLFVNGERRMRPRYPKQGLLRIESVPGFELVPGLLNGFFDGSDTFHYAAGDLGRWSNLDDVDIVVLHYWVEERMPIVSLDEERRLVKSSRRSTFGLKDDVALNYAQYYVDNVFEHLTEPGEWYLDRLSGKLYYMPMDGETIDGTQISAPRTEQLLRLFGDPERGVYIDHLHFRGLSFRHTDWSLPRGGDPERASGHPGMEQRDLACAPQAAYHLPGVIDWTGARHCVLEDCDIRHVGFYAVNLGPGCTGNHVVGNTMYDMGAGGVKLSGSDAAKSLAGRTGLNHITDNHIHRGGLVFHSGIGVVSRHAYGNVIAHNHIHDLYYTGISCGWVWGYADNVSRDNRIEYNHIHDLGHGMLNDMGGIYMLGVQPGTVIRGNVIHDIVKKNYGGWGIYLDEGSSHITVEDNLVYRLSSQCFHQHYGRENRISNNIFAFGKEGVISFTRQEEHISIVFERNIVLADNTPAFVCKSDFAGIHLISDLNLIWDTARGEPVYAANARYDDTATWRYLREIGPDEWRGRGFDLHSLAADPQFADSAGGNFAMPGDSPAAGLGFVPFDPSRAGVRRK